MKKINNDFYDTLDEKWYNDSNHIIALLRAESEKKIEYVNEILKKSKIEKEAKILDVGCGAGFVSNKLAESDFNITGIDMSENSLKVAERHAPSEKMISYKTENAYNLSFENQSFDVVMMLDFLEHVENPQQAIREASRVLKKDGILIFYTFNRNLLSALLAVKAVEIIARDCPKNFHVASMFIKPEELEEMMMEESFLPMGFKGMRPNFFSTAFFKSILFRTVDKNLSFDFCDSLTLGYLGYAIKRTGFMVIASE